MLFSPIQLPSSTYLYSCALCYVMHSFLLPSKINDGGKKLNIVLTDALIFFFLFFKLTLNLSAKRCVSHFKSSSANLTLWESSQTRLLNPALVSNATSSSIIHVGYGRFNLSECLSWIMSYTRPALKSTEAPLNLLRILMHWTALCMHQWVYLIR